MKAQALAVFGAVAAVLTSSASAGNEFAKSADIPSKPNCNSKGSIATYIGQEVYFRKHPFQGSGFTPAYGQWNVPCDPAKKSTVTGQAFPADAIKCSPTFAVNNGKDRMVVCIDSTTCPPNSPPTIGEEDSDVIDSAPLVNVAVPASVPVEELVKGICNRITPDDKEGAEGLVNFNDGAIFDPEDQEPTNGKDDDVQIDAPLDKQIQACQVQLTQTLRALELEEQQAELQGADADEDKAYSDWYSGAGIAFRRSCGTRYIAFSGSDDLGDWISDFTATPVLAHGTWFHSGFVGEYNGYNNENLKYIIQGPKYIYAGHSLGGAITQIAATHHKKLKPNQDIEYITHGTGAPFFKAQGLFASNANSVWNSIPGTNYINHLRTCNLVGGLSLKKDIVPSLLTGPNGLLQHKSTSITGLDEFSHWNWLGLCKQKTGVAVPYGWSGANTAVFQHFGDKYVERVNKLY